MKRLLHWSATLLLVVGGLSACSSTSYYQAEPPAGWTPLLDGGNFYQWQPIGSANWHLKDHIAQADQGTGFLVSRFNYKDFQIRAEFWADDDANSGIFFRCADARNVTDKTCYEANIFDKRPDPTYGTGAIVGFAKIDNMIKAGGRWNSYDITAKGDEITVKLNGVTTVQLRDSRFASGPIALQRAAGVIKFRKFEIRPL